MSTTYVIRVEGLLGGHWSERLGGHPLARHADGTTTITADVVDQAQLHGTLTAIRDIGVVLLEVRIAGSGQVQSRAWNASKTM